MTQDKQGFIWLGTFNGLSRYDGDSFTTFRNMQSDSTTLMNNHIESLLAVDEGLWVGTSKGLNYYSFCENRFYVCKNEINQTPILQYIKTLVKIGNDIYFLDSNRQVKKLVSNYTFAVCEGLPQTHCLAIAPYQDRMLVVLTMNGILLFDTVEQQVVSQIQIKLYNSPNYSIYYSKNTNNVYIGGGLGFPTLAYSLSDELEFSPNQINLPSDVKQVLDYHEDILFATDVEGIVRMNKSGNRTVYSPSNTNISAEAIHSLYIDKNDDLWIRALFHE